MDHEAGGEQPRIMKLPPFIFGPTDVRRIQRELELLEEYFSQSSLRAPGQQPKLPLTSRLLDNLAVENKVNLLVQPQRGQLEEFLDLVMNKAPVLHFSFAVDPSSAFMFKVVTWLRENIHPDVLVQLGLQPSVAVGCRVRTPNHWYDFSLAHRFANSQPLLMKNIEDIK